MRRCSGRRRRVLFLLTVALLAGGCSSDAGPPSAAAQTSASSDPEGADPVDCSPVRAATSSTGATYDDEGVPRSFDLAVPASYDGRIPAPLIVNLHGFSSTADEQSALSGMPEAAGRRGYVVLTPQAMKVDVPLTTGTVNTPFWNIGPAAVRPGFDPPDDLGFLSGLVDSVTDELCIDQRRRYVTGMSNGAGMTMAFVCGGDARFAAAAPVAGANLVGDCRPRRPIPTLAFHGDADPFVPYAGGQVLAQDYSVVGIEERLATLAERAACEPEPVLTSPAEDIELRSWTGCAAGTEVGLVTTKGGGHTWPSGATERLLDFFDAHPAR